MAQMHVWAQCSLLAAPHTALQVCGTGVLELPPVQTQQAHSGVTEGPLRALPFGSMNLQEIRPVGSLSAFQIFI